MNRSAVAFALFRPLTLAFTSTVPATCEGLVTVQVVIDEHVAEVEAVFPNLKAVVPVPGANPVPVTVTLVPPATGPTFGLSFVIVGGPNL